jgi:Na+-transporting methylmalonyl-CoA/oxaloacetate decarboxylase gamma subunit
MSSSGTSDMTTVDESTSTAPPIEKGFIDRLNDGFAGMDNVYLGGFLVVLIVLLMMISACAVVGFLIMRNRRRREPASAANAKDDGTELKGANAATVPQLSAPYHSLPAAPADYDLVNSGRSPVPGYDRVEDPTHERVDGYRQIQLPIADGYNVLPSPSPAFEVSSAGSLNLPPPTCSATTTCRCRKTTLIDDWQCHLQEKSKP